MFQNEDEFRRSFINIEFDKLKATYVDFIDKTIESSDLKEIDVSKLKNVLNELKNNPSTYKNISEIYNDLYNPNPLIH